MNKIVPFTKVITLNEPFQEIVKIALDETLKLEEPYLIKGDLIIRGCLKKDDKEEEFTHTLPVEIAIDSKYDASACSISIDDFYYEIINEQDIRVKIDLMIDDLYYSENEEEVKELILEDNNFDLEELEEEEDREEEILEEIIHTNLLDDKDLEKIDKVNSQEKNNFTDSMEDLFKETSDEKEYSIYSVYVLTENDTLEQILDKYNVTKEDLLPFNDLDKLQVGSKLIIPSIDE